MNQRRPRQKDERHLRDIRALPCCVCGDNTATEAAHIRAGSIAHDKRTTGYGERPDDRWTLPLCGRCHRDQHTKIEIEFWLNHGIDPFKLSTAIFERSKRSVK